MALTNFVLIGWLIGMQNARGPLAMLLTINLTNALLDFGFVVGFFRHDSVLVFWKSGEAK